MFLKRKGLLVIVLFALVWQVCHSSNIYDIRINEVMQSNVDYLIVDNDFPDSWVELYNKSDSAVDLNGAFIGLTTDHNAAYCIPQKCIIPPRGYVIIYCDKEDRGLHTNFRLESGKGDLYFFSQNGELIDELHHKKMPAPNVAFGRVADGAEEWQYEIVPTPGAGNSGFVSSLILPDPDFSIKGGIYDVPIVVTLSMPDIKLPEDTRIYITFDGSEPTESSESGETFSFDISKTTVIRAKLISAKALPTRSITNSYIYHHSKTDIPVISIVTDSTHLYGEKQGILVGGYNEYNSNCYQKWRRPLNVEYYHPYSSDIKTELNQLCEAAVAGNYSRAYPQKSLKLFAHKRFGEKRFASSFWDEKPNVSKVKSFKIRNYGTANLYGKFHDAAIQSIFGKNVDNIDWLGYQPVLVYINGRYSGIYEIRERSDEDFVESNYGGLEEIERCDHEVFYDASAREGKLFKDFYESYSNSQTTYDEIKKQMDVDNFMKVLIAEMFTTNYDYPQNNVSVWRETAEGSKWRWILKDMDYIGLRLPVTWNMFNYMFQTGSTDSPEYYEATRTERCYNSHELYKRMIAFPEFREPFVSRFAVYLGDFLKPSYTLPILDRMNNEIYSEIKPTFEANDGYSFYYGIYEQFARYDSIVDPVKHYMAAFEGMKDFYRERPAVVYSQMADYFSLGTPIKFKVDGCGVLIRMDDIALSTGNFDGFCFSNRAFKISAENSEIEWEITFEHTDGTTKIFKKPASFFFMKVSDFEKDLNLIKSITCRPLMNGTAVFAEETNSSDTGSYYNIRGERLLRPQRGLNIIKMKNGSTKKVIRE